MILLYNGLDLFKLNLSCTDWLDFYLLNLQCSVNKPIIFHKKCLPSLSTSKYTHKVFNLYLAHVAVMCLEKESIIPPIIQSIYIASLQEKKRSNFRFILWSSYKYQRITKHCYKLMWHQSNRDLHLKYFVQLIGNDVIGKC